MLLSLIGNSLIASLLLMKISDYKENIVFIKAMVFKPVNIGFSVYSKGCMSGYPLILILNLIDLIDL